MHIISSDGGGDAMTIKVYRTTGQALHRITLRHEYAFITTKRSLKDSKEFGLIRLTPSNDPVVNNYIYVGRHAYTRENFDKSECLMQIRKRFPSLNDDEVSFPDIKELYGLTEGKVLEMEVPGSDMAAVNRKWICECLQFKESEREYYLNDDFTSVKITFSKIAGRTVRHKDEAPVPVDVAGFDVYDRMIDSLIELDRTQHYGDGCFVEYSIISDDYEYRYLVTHFFSNHNWEIDPENLLNICFSAELLSGSCSKESVRFVHPSKITARKSDGAEYLVETIVMNNDDVSVKFRDGDTNEPSEADVAESRIYDNPVDFTLWADLYHQEIRMA